MVDNFYPNCPPMMDGRHLGDFQTATRRNEYIKYANDIYRNDQYRLFLQKNGKTFMDKEWEFHNKHNRCWVNDCVHNYPTRSTPRHFLQERQAYDSIYNLKTNKQMVPMRQCQQFKDFRMTN